MAKTIDDVRAALAGIDGGDELVEAVVTAIEGEKQRGISESRKLRKDVETYSKYKKLADTLGWDGAEDIDTFAESLSVKLENSAKGNSEVQKLQKMIEKMRTDFETVQRTAQEEKSRRHGIIAREQALSKLRDSAGNYIVHAQDLLVDSLLRDGRIKLSDDEKTAYFVTDDQEEDLKIGLEKYLENRKDLLKNNQRPGTGSKNTGGQGNGKIMQFAEFQKLPSKEQAAYMRDGGKLID